MADTFQAGERLAVASDPEPPRPPKRERAPKREPKPPRPRRGFSVVRLFGQLFGVLLGLGILGVIAGGFVGYTLYKRYSADLPDIDTLRHYQPRVMSRVYAADSRLLAELATERRIFVPIEAIPPLVRQAFISAEDQNFYTHKGIDPQAILRAVVTDIAQYGQGRRPIGASTITQQVAKNMAVGSEVSLARSGATDRARVAAPCLLGAGFGQHAQAAGPVAGMAHRCGAGDDGQRSQARLSGADAGSACAAAARAAGAVV